MRNRAKKKQSGLQFHGAKFFVRSTLKGSMRVGMVDNFGLFGIFQPHERRGLAITHLASGYRINRTTWGRIDSMATAQLICKKLFLMPGTNWGQDALTICRNKHLGDRVMQIFKEHFPHARSNW